MDLVNLPKLGRVLVVGASATGAIPGILLIMTATPARPTANRCSLFPWRHARGSQHPALKAAREDRTLGERVADEIASYIALNLVLSGLAGIQAPIIMMSQNRAAARDELLAQHHYEETQTIDNLLETNTDLTKQVHDLTQKVHELIELLCTTSGVELRGAGSQSP